MGEQTETFNSLISDVFGVNPADAGDATGPDDVEQWDSISHMELMAKFADEFGVDLDIDEVTAMETFGEMKNILRKHDVDV